MTMSIWGRRAGVSLTAVVLVAGVSGCQSAERKAVEAPSAKPPTQSRTAVTQTLTAAYEKTAAAKSAKVRMTLSMPAAAGGGGSMEITGTVGWDPAAMDVTIKGDAFPAAAPDSPEQIRMVMLDEVMYMDMGAKAPIDMDGKRWMKMDLGAMAAMAGDEAQEPLTGGLDELNQDPAQQLALLLQSPNLKHIGPQQIDGVDTQHYKGSLTVAEMLEANKSFGVLTPEERKELLAGIEKSGIEGYDTEVWVNEDGYPVRMDVGIDSPVGTVEMVANYSDYGVKSEVKAPPASETFDFTKMLEGLGEEFGADGTDDGTGSADGVGAA
ncbi:hypothetical protein ACWGI0_08945 [Streptomyces sp. NPDC054802]